MAQKKTNLNKSEKKIRTNSYQYSTMSKTHTAKSAIDGSNMTDVYQFKLEVNDQIYVKTINKVQI